MTTEELIRLVEGNARAIQAFGNEVTEFKNLLVRILVPSVNKLSPRGLLVYTEVVGVRVPHRPLIMN
jgi:hypothetical protein